MAVLSEEQTMIRDGAKSWVQEKSPVTAFRKLRDSGNPDGFDRAAWKEMAEMGWAGILIPEEFGGTGLGYLTLGLVLEETGRTLTASPLVSTALTATTALLLGGNDAQKKKYLPQIAEGKLIATVAVDEGPHHAPEKIALKAEKSGSGYKLNGKKNFVLDGGVADLIIVAARTSGKPGDKNGITLFLVDGKANGLSREKLKTVDSRGVANLTFANVEVGADAILGSADQGDGLLEAILDRARAGLAAEMLGHAMQSFDVTLDYLKTRVQFGQVIGTFQALQHRAAKMFTDLELARSCVEGALQAIDRDANDVAQLASLAKAKVGDLVHLVSNEMVQMHGGIGMTDAHDAGLYLKRARAQEATFGGSSFHRDRYATLLGY
ncbi:MAG TPA: acyl-CoA dehydrogenase family protein [Rhizomicrobium sp.]|jgi:alkylation response protein AidB-like acyl-CoA dehydrogenase|nr:acyl-CoA dehydrogenase family protein [Rhizomicrobium sp.]